MALARADFDYVAGLARRHSAIVLEPGKEYLVETRLSPLLAEHGFQRLEDFIAKLRADLNYSAMHAKVIDALTTNETLFFRDLHPFDALRLELIPRLIKERASERRLTIWSAACSTGQEPYSLAMMLREHFPQLNGWTISIVATDLSPRVLAQAKAGEYNQIEVNRGLPATYLVKYFIKRADKWVLKEDVRRMVDFRPLNLVQSWPAMPKCDIILLRNVLIYFDVPTKRSILANIRRHLAPDGYFFLGTAETTLNLDPAFETHPAGKTMVFRIKSS